MIDWRKEGYHILKLPELGEIHLEISGKTSSPNGSEFWEALVHRRERKGNSLCAVLQIIEDSLEELFRQVPKFLPGLEE